jgi:hypothetical protein
MFAENLVEVGYVWWVGSGFFFKFIKKILNRKVAHSYYHQLLYYEFLKFWSFLESTREYVDFVNFISLITDLPEKHNFVDPYRKNCTENL